MYNSDDGLSTKLHHMPSNNLPLLQRPAAMPVNPAAVAQKTSVPNSAQVNALNKPPPSVTNVLNHTMNPSLDPNLPPQRPIEVNQLIPQPSSVSNSQFSNSSPSTVIPVNSVSKSAKKGVKRKADTTTLEPQAFSLTGDDVKPSKMSTRRESGRPIKKPSKELPDVGISNSTGKKRSRISGRMKYCRDILKELFSKRHSAIAWPFYEPVNVRLYQLDDYFDVIKHPMDLGTIKEKLARNEYRKPDEFAADVRLIFTNCYKYNPPEHDVVQMGRKLQVRPLSSSYFPLLCTSIWARNLCRMHDIFLINRRGIERQI